MQIRLFVGFFLLVLLGEFKLFAQVTNEFRVSDTQHLTRVPFDEPFTDRYLRYTLDNMSQNTLREIILKRYPSPFPFVGDQVNSVGSDILNDSFKDAGRQIGRELPLYLYLETQYRSGMSSLGEKFSSKFSKVGLVFIENTIDGTAEESLEPTSLIYQPKENWLRRMREDGSMSYGLRPTSSPYLFFGTHIRSDGQELAFINARCYYRNLKSFQARFLVSVPLDTRWSLDTGFIYSPDSRNRKLGRVSVGVLRLERRISDSGFFFLGAEISQDHTLIGGFSTSW